MQVKTVHNQNGPVKTAHISSQNVLHFKSERPTFRVISSRGDHHFWFSVVEPVIRLRRGSNQGPWVTARRSTNSASRRPKWQSQPSVCAQMIKHWRLITMQSIQGAVYIRMTRLIKSVQGVYNTTAVSSQFHLDSFPVWYELYLTDVMCMVS